MGNNNEGIIFPLSPDSALGSKGNISVYYGFLKGALESKRIHNIAVTGGFGTGKSSFIRSYEKKKHRIKAACLALYSSVKRTPQKVWARIFWRNSVSDVDANEKPLGRFLYVSVGEYASDTWAEEKQGRQQKKTTPGSVVTDQWEEDTSIRAIERRMLLQIFARFRIADLPQSSFRLIPEVWTKRLWLISILFGGFVFAGLLLCFHEQLGAIIVAVNSMEGGPEWGAWVMAFLVKYKTLFRLLLSAYCIGFGTLASAFLCVHILPRIRFRAFTVKGMNTELSVEREAAESYLDLYSMELVYCLEKISRKIDHVVVFEDLDRLDAKDCLYIITRLREINNLVNLRLQKNGEPLRFIYAINDEFLGSVQHEKFFDFILPVIPEMNRRSAAVLFANKIEKIDKDYSKEVSDVFPQFETVVSCLSDYRLQNTILNEYQVLINLYTSTNGGKTPETSQKNEILAFAIYKNCWPEDYHALRENNSRIFTNEGVRCPKPLKRAKYGKLLEVLTDNHLLTIHSLYYIGFNEEELSKRYRSRWEANAQFSEMNCDQYLKDLISFREGDTNCLEEAGLFLIEQVKTINPEEYESKAVNPFRGLIACVVRCNYRENHWFTRRSDDSQNVPFFRLDTWLKLLSILTDCDDEVLKNNFTSLFLAEDRVTKTLFCDDNELNTLDLSIPMLKELCRAIPVFPKSVCFCISGVETPNPEKSDAVIQIRDELVFVQ